MRINVLQRPVKLVVETVDETVDGSKELDGFAFLGQELVRGFVFVFFEGVADLDGRGGVDDGEELVEVFGGSVRMTSKAESSVPSIKSRGRFAPIYPLLPSLHTQVRAHARIVIKQTRHQDQQHLDFLMRRLRDPQHLEQRLDLGRFIRRFTTAGFDDFLEFLEEVVERDEFLLGDLGFLVGHGLEAFVVRGFELFGNHFALDGCSSRRFLFVRGRSGFGGGLFGGFLEPFGDAGAFGFAFFRRGRLGRGFGLYAHRAKGEVTTRSKRETRQSR